MKIDRVQTSVNLPLRRGTLADNRNTDSIATLPACATLSSES